MQAWRRFPAILLALLSLCLALGASAVELKEGRDYLRIDPPLPSDPSRLEVTEFFWYGCPHCYDFEPLLAAWAKKLPADVRVRRVPAVLANPKWAPGARLFYTLEAMNRLDKLHGEVFQAIHHAGQRLGDEKVLLAWLAQKGVDAKTFNATAASFGVHSRVQQAQALALGAGVSGVPTVMVQGKYLALATGDYEELLTVIEQLLARARAETAAAAGRP